MYIIKQDRLTEKTNQKYVGLFDLCNICLVASPFFLLASLFSVRYSDHTYFVKESQFTDQLYYVISASNLWIILKLQTEESKQLTDITEYSATMSPIVKICHYNYQFVIKSRRGKQL